MYTCVYHSLPGDLAYASKKALTVSSFKRYKLLIGKGVVLHREGCTVWTLWILPKITTIPRNIKSRENLRTELCHSLWSIILPQCLDTDMEKILCLKIYYLSLDITSIQDLSSCMCDLVAEKYYTMGVFNHDWKQPLRQ